ncbi:peptidoglycan-binding protein [Streptomyces sp. Tu102]|uniref:peptidoglycan-binding domain-containing protein n=1 Tax=Streptomyces TaxID=1883 RepID=UPI001BDD605F|nr:peptidoglycan-binding protein [Streptomyces sp. Tu102]MBT1098370.1 peptidoglycan-binding protein [Streptomyces sp. Tu102]
MIKVRATRSIAALMLSACAVAGAGVVATGTPAAAAVYDCNTTYKWRKGTNLYILLPWDSRGTSLCYLSPGDSGRDVAALQYTLLMCYGRDIDVDGEFGSQTKAALQYAQRQEGIAADGYYGVESLNALRWQPRKISDGEPMGVCVNK